MKILFQYYIRSNIPLVDMLNGSTAVEHISPHEDRDHIAFPQEIISNFNKHKQNFQGIAEFTIIPKSEKITKKIYRIVKNLYYNAAKKCGIITKKLNFVNMIELLQVRFTACRLLCEC